MQWAASHGCYKPAAALERDSPYAFAYAHPCEPYPLALKATLPPFDERWRGRLLDKTSYVTHMAAWGFAFTVNPRAFMVHLPHAPAAGLWRQSKDDNDAVTQDLIALPYGLTRVMLEDLRRTPEFRVEVVPLVPGLSPRATAATLGYAPVPARRRRRRSRTPAALALEAESQRGGGGVRRAGLVSLQGDVLWKPRQRRRRLSAVGSVACQGVCCVGGAERALQGAAVHVAPARTPLALWGGAALVAVLAWLCTAGTRCASGKRRLMSQA